MESAQVRLRPFRLAFLAEPRDRKTLQRVFEMNSSLWGRGLGRPVFRVRLSIVAFRAMYSLIALYVTASESVPVNALV